MSQVAALIIVLVFGAYLGWLIRAPRPEACGHTFTHQEATRVVIGGTIGTYCPRCGKRAA